MNSINLFLFFFVSLWKILVCALSQLKCSAKICWFAFAKRTVLIVCLKTLFYCKHSIERTIKCVFECVLSRTNKCVQIKVNQAEPRVVDYLRAPFLNSENLNEQFEEETAHVKLTQKSSMTNVLCERASECVNS